MNLIQKAFNYSFSNFLNVYLASLLTLLISSMSIGLLYVVAFATLTNFTLRIYNGEDVKLGDYFDEFAKQIKTNFFYGWGITLMAVFLAVIMIILVYLFFSLGAFIPIVGIVFLLVGVIFTIALVFVAAPYVTAIFDLIINKDRYDKGNVVTNLFESFLFHVKKHSLILFLGLIIYTLMSIFIITIPLSVGFFMMLTAAAIQIKHEKEKTIKPTAKLTNS